MVSILKGKPIQGICTVLALVERGRKVSFDEAWRSIKLSGVRTYVI
jgi:hypothetical protein